MSWFFDNLFKRGTAQSKNRNISSYDTSRTETDTFQKVREGNEAEAIRQRTEQAEGDKK